MQHKASPRDRIVTKAKQLFAERGFHRTAMADLAEAAQVSVGTIYRAFPSKSEIIRAIIEADTHETLEELQHDIDVIQQGAVERRQAVEAMILRWITNRKDAIEHEIVAECHRNPQLAALVSCVCAKYREQFRKMARLLQPDADQIQIEGAVELLLACLFGMGNREFTAPALDDEQTAIVVSNLILKALN